MYSAKLNRAELSSHWQKNSSSPWLLEKKVLFAPRLTDELPTQPGRNHGKEEEKEEENCKPLSRSYAKDIKHNSVQT